MLDAHESPTGPDAAAETAIDIAPTAPLTPATSVDGMSDRWARLFPTDDSSAARPWWRRHLRILIASLVVVVLVVGGLFVTDAFGSSGPDYRTAVAGNHPVAAVIDGVAIIEPLSQATVAFPVSGTVATVPVGVGQTVAAGQPIATLDTQSLLQTLHERQASLARAQLTLSKALAGESVGGVGSISNSGSGGSGSGGSGSNIRTTSVSSPGTSIQLMAAHSGGNGSIAQAQRAVLIAQQRVDAALAAANAAVQSEQQVCAGAGTTTTTTTPGQQGQLTACQAAIDAVVAAQRKVGAAQAALATASSVLDDLLAQEATRSRTGSGSTTPQTGATGSSGSGASGKGGSSFGQGGASSQSSGPSAADLVAYQSAVDAAAAEVAVALQAVSQATINSPIAGQVAAVNLTVGDSVSSGSSTANIVVEGHGGFEVTTSVGVDRITDVAVGQAATIVPDGSHKAIAGRVVSIANAPTTSSNASTTTYNVVVGLADPQAALNNGATGSVSIVTKRARSALAVPTSAVLTNGSRHTVRVVSGGSAKEVPVTVGAVGATWTEITGGLHAGESVALADVNQPLPDSATSSTNGSNQGSNNNSPFGGRGGFGGFGGARRGAGGGG
jgi:multidrug efflux pump subunit AcrA (membrane-fusion protein)